ncbi:hypothetical protein, partial [Elioraea sp.]|uniref:hypothetical protein n=1 Tax=Elioraea sp. TaxID=2185103 RepID=UPI003F70ED05
AARGLIRRIHAAARASWAAVLRSTRTHCYDRALNLAHARTSANGRPVTTMEMTMTDRTKNTPPTPDTAEALAAIEALLRSVEDGWIPAARKVKAARRALDALRAQASGRE